MKYFKTVFLQDSVILRARWPNHPNFQLPLFQSAEYAEFARQVQEACANPEPGYNEQISAIILAVERELRGLRKETLAGHNRSYYQVEALARDMRTGLTLLAYGQNHVNYRLDQGAQFYIPSVQATLSFPLPPSLPPPKSPFGPSATPLNPAGEPPTQPSRGLSPLAEIARLDVHGSYGEPQFMMDRNVKTMVELWHEWTVGNGGKSAVEELDRESGSSWRLKDRSQYHRRKQLIDEIKFRLERTPFRDPLEVVHELNDIQKAGHHTLNWMYETWLSNLKKERKAAKTAETAAV